MRTNSGSEGYIVILVRLKIAFSTGVETGPGHIPVRVQDLSYCPEQNILHATVVSSLNNTYLPPGCTPGTERVRNKIRQSFPSSSFIDHSHSVPLCTLDGNASPVPIFRDIDTIATNAIINPWPYFHPYPLPMDHPTQERLKNELRYPLTLPLCSEVVGQSRRYSKRNGNGRELQ